MSKLLRLSLRRVLLAALAVWGGYLCLPVVAPFEGFATNSDVTAAMVGGLLQGFGLAVFLHSGITWMCREEGDRGEE